MRVIAGRFKGLTLKGPKSPGLRPTADRVKEALFNIIGSRIQEAVFLDLFAGSGAIGIEALSRGAARVVFGESHPASLKLLRQNLTRLGDELPCQIMAQDANRLVEWLAGQGNHFDIVFLDPPFAAGLLQPLAARIVNTRLLKPGGWLIAEHSSRSEPAQIGLPLSSTRTYGTISLSFWQVPAGADSKSDDEGREEQ